MFKFLILFRVCIYYVKVDLCVTALQFLTCSNGSFDLKKILMWIIIMKKKKSLKSEDF